MSRTGGRDGALCAGGTARLEAALAAVVPRTPVQRRGRQHGLICGHGAEKGEMRDQRARLGPAVQ